MLDTMTICFGSQSLRIEIENAHIDMWPNEPAVATVEAASAVQASLAVPVSYPPLTDALLEGDRVAIVVDWGVPRLSEVLGGVLATLSAANVSPESLTILLADRHDQDDDLLVHAPPGWQSVTVASHDPHDENGLAYLAANKKGEPIYFNRAILDADFVLPISVARGDTSLGDFGIFSGLFPAFTDAATVCRCNSGEALLWKGREKSRADADEAGWLLGSRFVLRVIPAPGGGIAKVISGDSDAVLEQSQTALKLTWQATFDELAPLVIACVGGGKSQQNWSNLARALDSAMRLATDDGAILLCCDIEGKFDRALSSFRAGSDPNGLCESHYTDDPFEAEERLDVESTDGSSPRYSPDLMLADWLRLGLENHRIYLMSRLDEDEVTDLGLIHVSSEKEVGNLCRRHTSCTILADAQHVQPRLRDEVTTH